MSKNSLYLMIFINRANLLHQYYCLINNIALLFQKMSKRHKAMPPYCASKTYPGLLTSSLPGTLYINSKKALSALFISLQNIS